MKFALAAVLRNRCARCDALGSLRLNLSGDVATCANPACGAIYDLGSFFAVERPARAGERGEHTGGDDDKPAAVHAR